MQTSNAFVINSCKKDNMCLRLDYYNRIAGKVLQMINDATANLEF